MDPKVFADKILGGDRRALARAITLIESGRADHRDLAEKLVAILLPHTGHAIRLGISGAPGVGKSTFIETFGTHIVADDQEIAVLAVDPSSQRSGGSILGDKTRMQRLASEPKAFIRPSPAGLVLGGVGRKTREAAIACEAAGFDIIVLETVGVGQAETAVAEMVDCFLLLLAPGAGDELQGLKRGIVELADIIVVNKADGDLLALANRAQSEYQAALHLLRPASPAWTPEVLTCSSLEGQDIDEVWRAIKQHRHALEQTGELAAKRARQHQSWLWAELQSGLIETLRGDPGSASLMQVLEQKVREGQMLPPIAARRLIDHFRRI